MITVELTVETLICQIKMKFLASEYQKNMNITIISSDNSLLVYYFTLSLFSLQICCRIIICYENIINLKLMIPIYTASYFICVIKCKIFF